MRKLNRRSQDSSNPAVAVAFTVAGAGACDVTEQHSGTRTRDLASENDALKREIKELRCKLANVSSSSSVGTRQSSEGYHKWTATKEQAKSLKSKQDMPSLCSTKSPTHGSAAKQSNDEVQKLKAQKVKLQCKIKLDSMHFRLCRASLEKEILQLKKEQRKSEFEKHVLLALNKRQRLILQLKHTQAFTAVKQLKLQPESRKISLDKNNGPPKGKNVGIQIRVQDSKNELQLMTRLNAIHSAYERQMKEIAEEIKKFGQEADMLKAEMLVDENSCSASHENQVAHSPIDSELKELKEEFNKLSTLVSQMEMTKSQLSEPDKFQGNSVESSISISNSNYQLNTESSPSENSLPSPHEPSQENLCSTNQSKAEACCSCTKRSLCKTPKCQCKANGSGCGESCGCTASKCTNRRAIQPVDDKENTTRVEGAARQAHEPPENNGDEEASKQPLRDIGNTLDVKSYAGKAGHLKKGRKRVAQK